MVVVVISSDVSAKDQSAIGSSTCGFRRGLIKLHKSAAHPAAPAAPAALGEVSKDRGKKLRPQQQADHFAQVVSVLVDIFVDMLFYNVL